MPSKATLILALVLAALLVACAGGGTLDEQDPSTLGEGDFGTAAGSNLASVQATDNLGEAVGHFEYDADQFSVVYDATSDLDPIRSILSLESGALQVTAINAQGRADTACRYQVALLARDQGFEPGLSGWKTNQMGLELYWATASKGGDYRAFYCALLGETAGISLSALSAEGDYLDHKALFDLLDSLRAY